MNAPKLHTDKVLGNQFQISPLPAWGFSIVSYNGKRRILVKKIFRAHLVESQREIRIFYAGLFGIRRFTYHIEGELLKFQFSDQLEFALQQRFVKVANVCKCLLRGVRVVRNETKLLHKPCRIQRDQVRIMPSEPKFKIQRKLPNFKN